MLYRMLLSMGAGALPAAVGLRSLLAALTAGALCLAAGGPLIAWLRRLKVGERTEKSPLESAEMRRLLDLKKGTPTMGGVLIVGALLASSLLWADPAQPALLVALGTVTALAALGAVDDLTKLLARGRRARGLKARHKLMALMPK